MNLPATAVNFLSAFIGSHAGMESLFEPNSSRKLPMVHVYSFTEKLEDDEEATRGVLEAVCKELQLGRELAKEDDELHVWDVRDVAPKKRMLCVSFRLPAELAFRSSIET